MKKAIYRTNYRTSYGEKEDEHLFGFDPGYLWKSVKYFRAPKNDGKYLVIRKDGRVSEMYCTGSGCSARSLFEAAADTDFCHESYLDDKPMTDSDLMDLYRSPYGRWYDWVEWHEYEDCHDDLYVYTENSEYYPLYFLDLKLDGTIKLNENGEIADCDGTTWFSMDENGDYVRAKTDSKE